MQKTVLMESETIMKKFISGIIQQSWFYGLVDMTLIK